MEEEEEEEEEETNLSQKKKREGDDDEWGRKIEKIEVHSIKEEAPSQATFFSNPSISISSFNSFCLFLNPLGTNLKKQKTKKNKQTKHICACLCLRASPPVLSM